MFKRLTFTVNETNKREKNLLNCLLFGHIWKMSYRNRKRDIATLQLEFITTMVKLAKLQVPVVAVWFDDDCIQTHGRNW